MDTCDVGEQGEHHVVEVPTLKKFCTSLNEESKNMIFSRFGHNQSSHDFCLACLLSFDEQPGWAERVRQLGMSNLEKNYIFGILM